MERRIRPAAHTETHVVTLDLGHWALIHQVATDYGYTDYSAALRRILDHYRLLRARQLELALDADCAEAAQATVPSSQLALLADELE